MRQGRQGSREEAAGNGRLLLVLGQVNTSRAPAVELAAPPSGPCGQAATW